MGIACGTISGVNTNRKVGLRHSPALPGVAGESWTVVREEGQLWESWTGPPLFAGAGVSPAGSFPTMVVPEYQFVTYIRYPMLASAARWANSRGSVWFYLG